MKFEKIKGFDSYEISRCGIIRSVGFVTKLKSGLERRNKPFLVKYFLNHHGYQKCSLRKNNKLKGVFVHRIVAQQFIPNPENKPHINHKNGIQSDHRIENLEWCTPMENVTHAVKTGLMNLKGEKNGFAKLTRKKVDEIKRDYVPFKCTQLMLAEKYKVHRATINKIINNKVWQE